jgi:hypothetical protein
MKPGIVSAVDIITLEIGTECSFIPVVAIHIRSLGNPQAPDSY